MTRRYVIKDLAKCSEPVEVYWHVGLKKSTSTGGWLANVVFRGELSGALQVIPIPIGQLPIMPLGVSFVRGRMSPARSGEEGVVLFADTAQGTWVVSNHLPRGLYDHVSQKGGRQWLYKLTAGEQQIYVPATELVRYFLLHDSILANVLMEPAGLAALFRPVTTADIHENQLFLEFMSGVPKSILSRDWIREFTWLAVHPEGRAMWDSVQRLSGSQGFVRVDMPGLQNSTWRYRGITHQNSKLVLEILHASGRRLPCRKLVYSHPLMTVPSKWVEGTDDEPLVENLPPDEIKVSSGPRGGSLNTKNIKEPSKETDFEEAVKVELLRAPKNRKPASGGKPERKKARRRKVSGTSGTLETSTGPLGPDGGLVPANLQVLGLCSQDIPKSLIPMYKALEHLTFMIPGLKISTALCELKQGRAFSMAGTVARVCLVASIQMDNHPPVVMLDVARELAAPVATLLLRYLHQTAIEDQESDISVLLAGLVDNSGHWDTQLEASMGKKLTCRHLLGLVHRREEEKSVEVIAKLALRIWGRVAFEVS